MPHVSERREDDDPTVRPQDRTAGPDRSPEGTLGGQPINADETAPRETVPEPHGEGQGGGDRHPEAVDDEPGSDL